MQDYCLPLLGETFELMPIFKNYNISLLKQKQLIKLDLLTYLKEPKSFGGAESRAFIAAVGWS